MSQHLRDGRVFLILVSASKVRLSCFKMPMSGSGDAKAFITGASEERKEPVSQKSYQRLCAGLTQVLCLSFKQTLSLGQDVSSSNQEMAVECTIQNLHGWKWGW